MSLTFDLKTDPDKNRLYLHLKGLASDDEIKGAVERVVEAIKVFRRPFGCITDLSEFKPLSAAGANEIKRAMLACKDRGMIAAVRVVGGSAIIKMQFDRATAESAGYPTFSARSVAEAESVLSQFEATRK